MDHGAGDGAKLRALLAERGIEAAMSADGTLVVLGVDARGVRRVRDARAEVVALARACGFTHVALELASDAPVGSGSSDADVRRAEPLA